MLKRRKEVMVYPRISNTCVAVTVWLICLYFPTISKPRATFFVNFVTNLITRPIIKHENRLLTSDRLLRAKVSVSKGLMYFADS
jgi:hypothetical protein